MVFGEGSFWISHENWGPSWHKEGRIERIDPQTHQTIATIPLSGDIAVGEGAVWVLHRGPSLSKIDPNTNQVVSTLPLERVPFPFSSLVVGEGGVWLVLREGLLGQKVVCVDPCTNQVAATIPLERQLYSVAAGEGAVWFVTCNKTLRGPANCEVLRLDPRTKKVVTTIPIGPSGGKLLVGEGWVWLVGVMDADGKRSLIKRINPSTNQVEDPPIRLDHALPLPFTQAEVGQGGLWCVTNASVRSGVMSCDRIAFVDSRTGKTREVQLNEPVGRIALGNQEIWVGWATPTGGCHVYSVRPFSVRTPIRGIGSSSGTGN